MCSSMLRRLGADAVLILVAALLVLATPVPVSAGPEQSVLASINAVRAKAGCGPLKVNAKLMAAAKLQARNMAEKDFFGHRGKDGRGFASRVSGQGYKYRFAAENIAAGQPTPQRAVQAWLDSPGHRRNIMDCKFRETGIAMVYQADDRPLRGQSGSLRYYWVQVFGVQRP